MSIEKPTLTDVQKVDYTKQILKTISEVVCKTGSRQDMLTLSEFDLRMMLGKPPLDKEEFQKLMKFYNKFFTKSGTVKSKYYTEF